MTIEETYLRVVKELTSRYESREAEQIAKILFEDNYGISNWKKEGRWDNHDSLEGDLSRLVNGEPIQYVTGIADFYGRKFSVNKNVLIPRPETEELVYTVVKQIKGSRKQYDILDVGTGSGCIPISIKQEHPSSRVFAMDYSQDALNVAKGNAKMNRTQITFYKFDFLDASYWTEMGRFDIIISNPPYIAEEERSLMADSVLDFEPMQALFPIGKDPLIFYRKIAEFAEAHLNLSGSIFLELNQYHTQEIDEIYSSKGYKTEIIKDLQGNDRILTATRK